MRIFSAIVMVGFSCLLSEAVADDFETETWPGEGIPVLISAVDKLSVRRSPSLDSPIRAINYRVGWKVPFDKSLYRTLRSVVVVVKKSATVEIWCDEREDYSFEAGQELSYLQYRAEGYGTARIGDKVCAIPILIREDVFGPNIREPETQWWVRVTYGDGTSPGWLNVMDGQVSFGDREL